MKGSGRDQRQFGSRTDIDGVANCYFADSAVEVVVASAEADAICVVLRRVDGLPHIGRELDQDQVDRFLCPSGLFGEVVRVVGRGQGYILERSALDAITSMSEKIGVLPRIDKMLGESTEQMKVRLIYQVLGQYADDEFTNSGDWVEKAAKAAGK